MNTTKKHRNKIKITALLFAALILPASSAGASSLSTNWIMAGVWEGPSGSLAHHAPQQSRTNTVTADGRLAVFWSQANNLVAGDTNNSSDIFIFDRTTKVTQRVNLGAGGTQSNGHTRNVTISADGRYIGFTTAATNTAVGPQCVPGHDCTFSGVLDRSTGAITVGSKDNSGQLMPVTYGIRPIVTMHTAVISGDGKSLLFSATSPSERAPDIYVRNLAASTTKQANISDQGIRSQGGVYDPTISNDGRHVAFSTASSLAAEDNNSLPDVYVRDMLQAKTKVISLEHNGTYPVGNTSESAVISGDGQFVVYKAYTTGLPGSPNDISNIFLYNTQNGSTKQISNAKFGGRPNGSSYNPSISADGSHITFLSAASNLVRADLHDSSDIDIFLYYGNAGITRAIKLPPRTDVEMSVMGSPVINGNGKAITYQLFTRSASNQAANAHNIYFNYDPVSYIPFYDPGDILDLLP
ncbi:MAG TPA: hypothetical protein VFO38_05940 [Candidatus Saccharimonadales bacterium]|nr:hypothetical protein [Candidatus Saccharimonadales bacterium]